MRLNNGPHLLLLALSCALPWKSVWSLSTVTVGGERCAADHQCGQHGYGYYWCYKDRYGVRSSQWDYCCRPGHPCDDHGLGYNWCHNGYGWSYCNKEMQVPRTLTVSGKRCAPGHPCDQHGESYHWCYVAGGWDYCCKPDHPCHHHDHSYDWCYVGRFYSWRRCQAEEV